MEKDEDLDFLDQIIEKTAVEKELHDKYTVVGSVGGAVYSSKPSVIKMDRKFFSYKREMK